MAVQTFDEIIASTTDIFLDAFGAVDIVYRPKDTNGESDRHIKALIKYDIDRPGVTLTSIGSPIFQVAVKNDSSEGISSSSDGKLCGDGIYAPPRYKAERKWCRILRIVRQNAAFVTIEVQ